MTKIAIASVLSAVALFIWGFIFWATPISAPAVSHGADVDALQEALRTHIPETGTYVLPDMDGRPEQAYAAAHRRGPIATLFVRKEGSEPMAPGIFIKGILHMFVTSLILAFLLKMALPALPSYVNRVMFVALAGFAAAFWNDVGVPVWFLQPWAFHLMTLVYDVVAWLLVGLILAWFIKPGVE